MFRAIRTRLEDHDRGFTLIELMVVVLIIAILIAIAIPTFLGARTKAQDRAAQADLRQGLLTAKTYYTDNQSYLDVAAGGTIATTATLYSGLEPSLSWEGVAAGPSANTKVDVAVATTTDVVLLKQSKSGTYFCIHDSSSAPTTYGKNASASSINTAATCTGGW